MNKFDLCALLCRCCELTELGHDTFYHFCPHINRVRITHYFGRWDPITATRYESFNVVTDNDADNLYDTYTLKDACARLDGYINALKGA